jgi:phage-related minor tail protein
MCGAVIVMTPFEGAARGHSKDHAVAASSYAVHAGNDRSDRATPLSGTQLARRDSNPWLLIRRQAQTVHRVLQRPLGMLSSGPNRPSNVGGFMGVVTS